MKYIVIPIALLEGKEQELSELSLDPRLSSDGTEAILHVEHYEELFLNNPVILKTRNRTINIDAEPTPDYLIYDNPSEELDTLLNSNKWSNDQKSDDSKDATKSLYHLGTPISQKIGLSF